MALAAVVSTARRSWCRLAAAAACRWRRLPGSGAGISEMEVERLVEEKLRDMLDNEEVQQMMESKIREMLRADPSITNPSQETHMFVENTTNKQAIHFNEKLRNQTEYFGNKISGVLKQQDGFSFEIRAKLDAMTDKCEKEALKMEAQVNSLKQQHADFGERATVQKTQYNIVKGATGVGVAVAVVGLLVFSAHVTSTLK